PLAEVVALVLDRIRMENLFGVRFGGIRAPGECDGVEVAALADIFPHRPVDPLEVAADAGAGARVPYELGDALGDLSRVAVGELKDKLVALGILDHEVVVAV